MGKKLHMADTEIEWGKSVTNDILHHFQSQHALYNTTSYTFSAPILASINPNGLNQTLGDIISSSFQNLDLSINHLPKN